MKLTVQLGISFIKFQQYMPQNNECIFSFGADNSNALPACAVLWICSQQIWLLASIDQGIFSKKLLSNMG